MGIWIKWVALLNSFMDPISFIYTNDSQRIFFTQPHFLLSIFPFSIYYEFLSIAFVLFLQLKKEEIIDNSKFNHKK
jgi:hypothetical protein